MGALGGRFHVMGGIIPVIRVESMRASTALEMGKRSTIYVRKRAVTSGVYRAHVGQVFVEKHEEIGG